MITSIMPRQSVSTLCVTDHLYDHLHVNMYVYILSKNMYVCIMYVYVLSKRCIKCCVNDMLHYQILRTIMHGKI